MAHHNKISVTDLPKTDDTNEFFTFGVSGCCSEFSASSSYGIGDLVLRTDGITTVKYMFKNEHVAAEWNPSDVVETDIPCSNVKVDMSFVSEALSDVRRKGAEPDDFSETTSYRANDVVKRESKYYMFTSAHTGAWSSSDVREVGYMLSLNERDTTWRVTAAAMCDDSGFVAEGVRMVAKPLDGGRAVVKTTGSDGTCVLPLDRRCPWVVCGCDKDGRECRLGKMVNPMIAHFSDEIAIWYVDKPRDTVNLTIRTTYDNYSIPASSINVCAMSKNGCGSIAGITDANGVFTGTVAKDDAHSVFFQKLSYLNNPVDIVTSTVTDCDKTVSVSYDSGVYYVCGSTEASRNDGTAWKEFKIDEFPIDPDERWGGNPRHPLDHPCVLVHVATNELKSVTFDHSSMKLLPATDKSIRGTAHNQIFNYDKKYDASYYIRVKDLTSERDTSVTTGRQWCTQNYLHTHVTTDITTKSASSYDGPLMTSYIDYDSGNLLLNGTTPVSATSPAAEYAMGQEFDLGGRKLHGFIGTYMQMDPLFKLSPAIYQSLAKFGYLANFKTGTYWWSCTQKNNACPWEWYSTSIWSYLHAKTATITLIPFFT